MNLAKLLSVAVMAVGFMGHQASLSSVDPLRRISGLRIRADILFTS
jgi:hypothetical protein